MNIVWFDELFPAKESSDAFELSTSIDKTSNITKMDTTQGIKHVTKGIVLWIIDWYAIYLETI